MQALYSMPQANWCDDLVRYDLAFIFTSNFFLQEFKEPGANFLKDFFRTFLFSSRNLESCPELYSKESEIGQKKYFFREDF